MKEDAIKKELKKLIVKLITLLFVSTLCIQNNFAQVSNIEPIEYARIVMDSLILNQPNNEINIPTVHLENHENQAITSEPAEAKPITNSLDTSNVLSTTNTENSAIKDSIKVEKFELPKVVEKNTEFEADSIYYITNSFNQLIQDDSIKRNTNTYVLDSLMQTEVNRPLIQIDSSEVMHVEKKFAQLIDKSDIARYLLDLSSENFKGRKATQGGGITASNYIEQRLLNMQIPTWNNAESYRQKFRIREEKWKNLYLKIDDKPYKVNEDYYAFTKSNNKQVYELSETQVSFLGYGIDDMNYSDYKDFETGAKVIIILQGEPRDKYNYSYVTGKPDYSSWSTDWKKKLVAAKRRGVELVLIVENDIPFRVKRYQKFLSDSYYSFETDMDSVPFANSIYVSPKIVKKLLGDNYEQYENAVAQIKEKGGNASFSFRTLWLDVLQDKTVDKFAISNLVSSIEGKTKPNEAIVVTAHFDHLGITEKGNILHGANNNASGTAALLSIMHAFAQAQKQGFQPDRTILFVNSNAHALGKFGSEYFIKHCDKKMVANINLDMIGRMDSAYTEPNYAHIISTNVDENYLKNFFHQVDSTYQYSFAYNNTDEPNKFYARSDNYNFVKNNVPSIFYFGGNYADLNRPTDTADKINVDLIQNIAQQAFYAIWKLANSNETLPLMDNTKKETSD